jgi:hypothetical protein
MMTVEVLVEGEVFGMSAAKSMHEAGIEISKIKERIQIVYPDATDILVQLDGQEFHQPTKVDVRWISHNMKSQNIENKLLGCHEI